MRKVHWLAGRVSNEQPQACIWFDTETKHRVSPDGKQHHYLWFGWACYQRRADTGGWRKPTWQRFDSPAAFWDWCCSKSRDATRLYLFAHNGAFDLPVVHAFSELPARGFELKSAVVDAPPMILTWKRGKQTIRFVDTLNLWRMPLDQIGESIGIPKLDMPAPTGSRTAWDDYCRRDVEVIRRAVVDWLDFLKANDLGGFMPTLASQAFTAYRHRFMAEKILIDDNEDALAMARESYLGGRVECFRIGEFDGEYFYLDVNSMYPSVMREGLFPTKLLGVYGHPTGLEIAKWLTHRGVIAECLVETDEPAYPVVRDGRLIFPVGRFRATLCGPELNYAMAKGHWLSSPRAAVYEAGYPFKDFVEFFYGERQKAVAADNPAESWRLKIMMNSLYGKFGQAGRRFENIGHGDVDTVAVWTEIDADDGTVRNLRQFGGLVQEWVNEGESRESHPAIAAYVTSYGRIKLWEGIVAAGRQNCLYCDTDSVVVNRQGYERLIGRIDEKRIGQWKVERELQRVALFGPKDYVFDGERRIKGIRKKAQQIADDQFTQDHFVGFKGLLRLGSLDQPIVYPLTKKLRREYLKGTLDDKGHVSPFVLTDGE